ncbi:hypothetical protein BGX27_006128 [Mortierella sp. AM989]|nr:hypothetical protein BGX27_006128 [Mortierella sp. AM989]
MDIDTSASQDIQHEDSVMETGQVHIQHPIAEHHTQPAKHLEHSSTSADNNGMDIDSHMGETSSGTSIESVTEPQSSAHPSIVSAHPDNQATNTVDTHSIEKSSELPTTSVSPSNPDDRIDAALAGKDDKEDGYESSDLESSDNDSDGPESSDSDSDIGTRNSAMTVEQREKALIEIDEMDEDDDITPSKILHTVNEIIQLPEVKKPEIVLGPDTVLEPIGTVMSIVDNVVVVQAASSGETRVLDAGTVAAVMTPESEGSEAKREVLGEIFETFGPVARPLYSIRFNTAAEIPTICILGCKVYSVPEYSSFILTGPLKAMKGSDASNKFDEEVHDSEMEFSDDEKEIEHNRMMKQKRKQKGKKDRKAPNMAADTSAAMQAMMGIVPTPTSSTTQSGAAQNQRKPIALPRRPMFNEPEDGYRILQRPGDMSESRTTPKAEAGAGTVPWYQQQQRELQSMIGSQQQQQQQQPSAQQQIQKEQDALLQFQKQQQIRQELLMQQQQQQQLFQQQQQQQAAYQKQIQEAQATIQRLQQQQQQLQQQHNQQQQQPQPAMSHQMNASFNPQQAHLQPTGLYSPQQPENNGQQQQIANLLSPLFHPTQNQAPQ